MLVLQLGVPWFKPGYVFSHKHGPARDIQNPSQLYIPTHADANGLLGLLPPPSSLVLVAVSSATTSLPAVVSSPYLIQQTSGSALSTGLLSATLPLAQMTALPQLTPTLVSPELLSCYQPGLILLPACNPILQLLVQRVQSGQFADMRDLLAENTTFMSQLSSLQGTLPLSPTTIQ